tara:strand:+ start:105 stop:335 length:231 start_codon:yes stop_codon:yes gene_type:complete
MKHKYKSNVPRDKSGRFLLKNEEDLAMVLMWCGFGLLILPIPALTLAIYASIVWLSYVMVLTMWLGLMMIAVGTIV